MLSGTPHCYRENNAIRKSDAIGNNTLSGYRARKAIRIKEDYQELSGRECYRDSRASQAIRQDMLSGSKPPNKEISIKTGKHHFPDCIFGSTTNCRQELPDSSSIRRVRCSQRAFVPDSLIGCACQTTATATQSGYRERCF